MSDRSFRMLFSVDTESDALPIWPVTTVAFGDWMASMAPRHQAFLKTTGFTGRAGQLALLPGADGAIEGAAFGLGQLSDPFCAATLSAQLPSGCWALKAPIGELTMHQVALSWALGTYAFDRYTRKPDAESKQHPQLHMSEAAIVDAVVAEAEAMAWVRDLVNTPAADMTPADLAAEVARLAERHGAAYDEIVGDALVDEGYPMVHAVGRAADVAPRISWLTWGEDAHPKVTLVGKGVCFDSGGLNLKPGASMRNMKKDMGGAAHVLGLASLIMGAKLPVRLRVIVPAVENAIGAGAFRPGDVLSSRKGLTVEIGNTDAEGRLILGDALAFADAESPDLLVDMATLTGAARVALGPELPPYYTRDADFSASLERHAEQAHDPVWRMPLWAPYEDMLDSPIADVCHIGNSPKGGSITAALFLGRFVEHARTWVHLDVYAWNDKGRPGRPAGGEAQGLRALFHAIAERYSL
ncbi:MAG: leucyl aminopeptidase family protein [Bradymonadia bacterium]